MLHHGVIRLPGIRYVHLYVYDLYTICTGAYTHAHTSLSLLARTCVRDQEGGARTHTPGRIIIVIIHGADGYYHYLSGTPTFSYLAETFVRDFSFLWMNTAAAELFFVLLLSIIFSPVSCRTCPRTLPYNYIG
jgi:hypothetical protein